MTPPPAPLPGDISRRLDVLLAKPLFRKTPRVAEAISLLVRDACARRFPAIQPALALAERHRPAELTAGTCCKRCTGRPRWPCREAVIAAEILHALGHELPYPLPRAGHLAYSPEPAPENEGAAGPGNSRNPVPDGVRPGGRS